MRVLLLGLLLLVAVASLALVAFAIFAELPSPLGEIVVPVTPR